MSGAMLYGFLTGMALSVMLGTVFFALIQNSVDKGFKAGVLIALGVIFSDIILISIAYFKTSLIPEGGKTELLVRLFGSIFLIYLGLNNLRRHKKLYYPKSRRGKALVFVSTGFLLNILNPGNLISWIAVSAYVTQVAQYKGSLVLSFFGSSLTAIFLMELLIAFSATKLKRLFTDTVLRKFEVIVGVLFLVFALVLMWPIFRKMAELCY